MNILKSIPMLAALLLALVVGAAPAEPTIAPAKKAAVKASPKTAKKAAVKACPKAAKKAECKAACAKACKGLSVPRDAKKMSDSDSLFSWYQAKDGKRYLVYAWEKPAVIYSVSTAENSLAAPGRELAIIHPEGRSKGKIKAETSLKVVKLNPKFIPAATLVKGMVIGCFIPTELYHDSVDNNSARADKLTTTWGESLKSLWLSTGIYDLIRQTSANFKSTWTLGLGRVLMICVSFVLIYLAIVKGFEPLLLLPIGFGALLANIPLAGISGPDGLQGMIYNVGIETGVFPLLIFMGVGAMTDFGPLIANPKTSILGGAAQFGIFSALIGATMLTFCGFDLKDAASIGIIGGADGPTSIYLTSKLSPKLLGAVAVAAYSYMALVPIIQPPIMKLLTTESERKIRMTMTRSVSKVEKICFPVLITVLCALLLPDAAPLIGFLMFGNLMRECGVVERLNQTAQNALINIVTIFLGIAVGSKLSADQFLSIQTLGILLLGAIAFSLGTAAGVIFAKIMNIFSKEKINPLIGAAGVSAVPMAARVANKVGQEADPGNFLLMHAMGPNVAGVIGSAVAAGVLLNMLKGL